MNIMVLDFESIGLEKQFAYDLGYVIADKDSGEIIKRKSYVISQVWNNKPLMATSYYASKTPLYEERLKSGYSKKASWGNVCRWLANDLRKYNITEIYAYNSRFDSGVFNFMCNWFKVENPLGCLEIKDIMGYIKPITDTDEYKDFCVSNGYMTKHKTPRPQKKAETLYRFMTNNIEFVEEHTGLEDSLIELEILRMALGI